MTRVLVVCGDPVGPVMAGPGIRSLEMARALARSGASVTLAAPGAVEVTAEAPGAPAVSTVSTDDPRALRRALAAAEAVVAGGMTLAQLPLLARSDLPVAVDLYGPYVLENLAAVAAAGPAASERARRHASDLAVLNLHARRGDFFVCASEVQRDFWLGLLVALGRVNPATHGHDPTLRRLLDVVPFGLPATPPRAPGRPVLRGVVPGFGPHHEIVLWGGGLWDWLDPSTLVEAAGLLVARRPALRVLFLAGSPPGGSVGPMAAGAGARARARELGLLDRVVFFREAWLPYGDRAGYLLEADVGCSLHLPHVETRYAFRTRLLDCFWARLPVVVSGGDVLSELVARHDLGRVVPCRDAAAVAGALAELLDAPGGRAAMAPRFDGPIAALTWSAAVRPLAAYLERPWRAADRPSVVADVADTPLRRLPGRAVAVLAERGPFGLVAEARRYVRWRRRPR